MLMYACVDVIFLRSKARQHDNTSTRQHDNTTTMKQLLTFFAFLTISQYTHAQENFYNTDSIQEIRIYFTESNWDGILDDLYVAGQEERLLASVSINGEVLDSVGIRYKGFSSVSTDRAKNPFNIKLDYVIDGQDYDGIDKVKLSNVIQDPSFLREVYSYEIGRKYMPAPMANYANVYINDTLWGLYTNVEAINKDFINDQYGNKENTLFKCNPEVLDFDGDNANLSKNYGTDSTNYYPFYDLKSDAGWADLYQLIEVLNDTPQDIESVLNVDRTLWMHAFNYTLVNFDSYIGYAQNYYLYKDDNGQFNPIIWDLNMSFASYRFSDASEFWDGFSIQQAKTIDPLLHLNSVSVYDRPLMRNLFENDTYKRMYLAHIRTIIEENFANQDYTNRCQELQGLVDASVAADTNKFYTYSDFQNNLTSTVSDLIDYPGITELMDARTAYLSAYPGFQGSPDINSFNHFPLEPTAGNDLWITADISNTTNVILAYRYGGSGLFTKVNMLDDGTQNDGAAGDGLYGFELNNIGSTIHYYIYAENADAGRFEPARAAYQYHTIQSQIDAQELVINEFMAVNLSTVTDEYGEFDDWIELYNTTNADLYTGGLYLSDNPDQLTKWALPDIAIPPNGYLVIWADEDGSQGELHANFKLSSLGESLTLAYADGTIIDEVIFSIQANSITTGRYPNGTGPFVDMFPTLGVTNLLTSISELNDDSGFIVSPNPAHNTIRVSLISNYNRLEIRDVYGRLLQEQNIAPSETDMTLRIENYPAGLYYLSLFSETDISTKKIIAK